MEEKKEVKSRIFFLTDLETRLDSEKIAKKLSEMEPSKPVKFYPEFGKYGTESLYISKNYKDF